MNGNIYIPKPCHEDWTKMSLAEKGRHCEVCSKVVTDFSKMNKEEIITTLKESKDELCGHIPMDQLTASGKKQKIYFWLKGTFMPKLSYAVFGILGFTALFKKSANAQMIDGKIVMVNGGAKYQESAFGSKKVNVVVVDEQNNPVPNAIVDIKINDAVMSTAVTSSKGECSNMVEIESSGYSLIDIEVSADGYKQKVVKQIRVSKDNQTYRVKLDEEVIIMGKFKVDDLHFPDYTNPEQEPVIIEPVKCNSEAGITIDQPTLILINPYPEVQPMKELDIYMDQESISEEVAPRFQLENNTLSFIAFPNPTIADLTIQTKEELTFDIKIFNENGALVLQLLNQYQRAQISLEGSAAGNYFAMIFINNKAIETHKIILIR